MSTSYLLTIWMALCLLIYYPFYPKFRWDFHRNALSRTNWASNSFAELSCRLSFTSQFREVLAEFRNEYMFWTFYCTVFLYLLKVRYFEKATIIGKISHHTCFEVSCVMSNQVGIFFKLLWPIQKIWTFNQKFFFFH